MSIGETMVSSSTFKTLGAAVAAFATLASTPALAAVRTADAQATLSPWVALSATASTASSTALCGASLTAAASSAAQQPGAPGCVFPVVDQVAPVAPAPAPAPVQPVPAPSIGALPLILGLAGLAGLAVLLFGNGDGKGLAFPIPVTQV